MISLISILLAILIIILFYIFKRRFIIKYFRNIQSFVRKEDNLMTNYQIKQLKTNNDIKYSTNDHIYNFHDKALLRRRMKILFNGSKEEKIKALKIAENLSDYSTINLLKRGLKDMDPDVIKISAKLIEKFK